MATPKRHAVLALVSVLVATASVLWNPPPATATSAPDPLLLTNVTLGAGTAPVAVAVTPDGSRAYVANRGSHTVSVMNAATNTITATIPGFNTPHGIAISSTGNRAYVTNSGDDTVIDNDTVSMITTTDDTITATLSGFNRPHGIAITPDGDYAYVANSGNDAVRVIRTSDNTITATISLPAGATPFGIAITPDGTRAYITNSGNNTVSVIRTSDNTITATVTGLNTPHGIAITPDGTRAYVANRGTDAEYRNDTVSVIATASNSITSTIADFTSPDGVAVSADGSAVYVGDAGGAVMRIATATNTIAVTVEAFAAEALGIAVNPSGARIYATGSSTNSLAILGTGARVTCTYAHSWPSGSGTTANPYRVASQSDLNAIRYCPSSAFILTQDIALTGSWTPIGTRAVSFTGDFDGDGHTITGLVMDNTSAPSGEPVGLFGMAQGATMRDLTISGGQVSVTRDEVGLLVGNCEVCEIASVEVTGTVTVAPSGVKVGGLAGHLTGTTSTLANSSSAVVVQGNSLTGGLVGLVVGATVTDTCASGAVTGTTKVGGLAGSASNLALLDRTCATGAVTGSQQVGGLVGVLGSPDVFTPGHAASIHRSFATGDVTATDPSSAHAGGLVGWNLNSDSTKEIADSYSSGSVVGTSIVGGLVGASQATDAKMRTSYAVGAVSGAAGIRIGGVVGDAVHTVEGNFTAVRWNIETTGRMFGVGSAGSAGVNLATITGLTSEQMRYSTNFAGWDFTSVWGYDCQRSLLPQLRWYVPTATASSCPPSTPNAGPSTPSAEQVTPTSSPTPTASTSPASSPVPAGISLKPGRARAAIGGVEVPVRTTALRRGRGTVVTVGSMRFTLRSTTPSGQAVPTAPNGALVVARSGALPITGEGVAPGSEVTTTLYSNPIPLSLATAAASGSFASRPTVPATVPRGTHTLSLTGSTASGAPFTLNLGVTVASPAGALGAHPVVSVQPHPARTGDHLTIRVAAVQAGCVVEFSLGSSSARTRSSARGQAQATLVVPVRGSLLKTHVRGKGCADVRLAQEVRGTQRP